MDKIIEHRSKKALKAVISNEDLKGDPKGGFLIYMGTPLSLERSSRILSSVIDLGDYELFKIVVNYEKNHQLRFEIAGKTLRRGLFQILDQRGEIAS